MTEQRSLLEHRLAAISRRELDDRTLTPGEAGALLVVVERARALVAPGVLYTATSASLEVREHVASMRLAVAALDRALDSSFTDRTEIA